MNVVPLTEFSSDRQFEAHFRSLPRVVLEGDSDVAFFLAWFEHLLSELDFVSAKSISGAAGCTAVGQAVQQSIDDDGIPAIGIVDRDWLSREQRWDLLYSLDDNAATNAKGGDVVTASLWEIEAYLLLPELMGRWVGLQRNPPPASQGEKGSALARVVEECDALLFAMPFFASAHAAGEHCDIRYFRDVAHHNMPEKCGEICDALEGERRVALEQVDSLIAAIRTAAPADPERRLSFLLRYLDTKRLLERVGRRLKLHADAHHALSELMSLLDLRPAELEEILNNAVARFNS
ncbi:hypothetical protein BWQ93_03280 [Sphingopyxis sp. QXT-31]|uniref:hypothetical protein n=1 Tax=Sphingopyxis sp. QXT-31 TaxID=1357916 RepID=UPI0009792BE2|nr:hypothetical protein [Sphingopyxis sp. QXT-31]APZ97616.1 hypothetical protein BWQ93_03280 [Sphingopyxis sp. QXT-31]